MPSTAYGPRPHTALMSTRLSSGLTGLRVYMTPLAWEGIISMQATAIDASLKGIPMCSR